MNVILSVLQNLDPVPGGICRAIFIGKVYWRQELVDLIFSLCLDLLMALKRRQEALYTQFDQEELAEKVMEILYRQVWTCVLAHSDP